MTRGRTRLEVLQDHATRLEARLETGHAVPGVVTRWRRELTRTRALIACLQDGRRRGDWTAYLDEVRQ